MTMHHLSGTNPSAVIDTILRRQARLNSGDATPDGRKLALVIEGGALRAVCSAGGAVVLAQLGFSELFDEVYATSAAVMNAAYFISNQPLLGISVYFDNCTKSEFISPWRFWKIVDVDYIFDQVAVHEKPLDVARVLGAATTLFVSMADRSSGEGFMVNTKTSSTPLLQVLKASAALPVLYNRAVEVDGRLCIDGGFIIPFGLREALSSGCTDVLVLSTRPKSYRATPPGMLDRFLFNVMSARGNAALRYAYAEKHVRSNELRELACGDTKPLNDANIATICADEEENISRTEMNRDVLHAAATSYGRKTLGVFGGDRADWALPEDCGREERQLPLLDKKKPG